MPNYRVNYEVTDPQDTVEAALTALGLLIEKYPDTVTIYFKGVMPLSREREGCVAWMLFNSRDTNLVDDAAHSHVSENVTLA